MGVQVAPLNPDIFFWFDIFGSSFSGNISVGLNDDFGVILGDILGDFIDKVEL